MDDIGQKIHHLSDLLLALEQTDPSNLHQLAACLSLDSEELKPFASYSQNGYTRNCLVRTDDYELLLLAWEAGQSTPIHEHNEQECWVHFLEGNFTEEVFSLIKGVPQLINETVPSAGNTSYMNDDMGCHRLCNQGPTRGLSLHLYVGPIDECKIFNEEEACFESQPLSYDLQADLLSRSRS